MTRNTRRWARLGPFVAAALVAYGGFRLLVRPGLIADLSRAESEVIEFEERLSAGEGGEPSGAEAVAAEAVAGELARTKERVDALSGFLASPMEGEAVLHSLGSLASEAGIRFLRFAPEPEFRLDGYMMRAASVVAEGAFFDFLRFFERVSLLPQLVLIEDVGLEGAPEGLVRCRFAAVTVRAAEFAGDPVAEFSASGAPAGALRDDGGRAE